MRDPVKSLRLQLEDSKKNLLLPVAFSSEITSSRSTLKLKCPSAWQSIERATWTRYSVITNRWHSKRHSCVRASVHMWAQLNFISLKIRFLCPVLCLKLSHLSQVVAVIKLFSYVLHNLWLSVLKCPFALTLHDFLLWVWLFVQFIDDVSLVWCTALSVAHLRGLALSIITGSYQPDRKPCCV